MSAALPELRATRCVPPRQAERHPQLGPGQGLLAVASVDGASTVIACRASSPLRVFTPRPRGRAVWSVVATLGGGLVAGDAIDLTVDVAAGATALIATQSEAKVYRSAGRWASHGLRASVSAGATLLVIPEPTSCFESARYRQEQVVELEPGGNLLLLDTVVAGRAARGERWAFDAYVSRNVVGIGGRTVLADAIRLVRGEGPPPDAAMDGFALLGTIVVIGPSVTAGARALLEAAGGRTADRGTDVLASASPLAGGVHLRFASRTLERGLAFVRQQLAFAAEIVGEDPFARRP